MNACAACRQEIAADLEAQAEPAPETADGQFTAFLLRHIARYIREAK